MGNRTLISSVLTISKMEEKLGLLDLYSVSVLNMVCPLESSKNNYIMYDFSL